VTPSGQPRFVVRPNGDPYWVPQNAIAVPVLVSGPPGVLPNEVLLNATWKSGNGSVLHDIPLSGTAGQEDPSHNFHLKDVTQIAFTLTIGQNICCPSGLTGGGYVVYGGVVAQPPSYQIDYPGPNPGNNPAPCVRLDTDKVVNIAPDNPDRTNCPNL
jgi:hypothetical protein